MITQRKKERNKTTCGKICDSPSGVEEKKGEGKGERRKA